MKSYIIAATGLLSSLFGVLDNEQHDSEWGYFHGAKAKVIFEVVDENDRPITNADVSVSYRTDYPKLKTWKEKGRTDSNGTFTASAILNHRLNASFSKDGYYTSFDCVNIRDKAINPAVVDGRWQPYGQVRKTALKPYKRPVNMSGRDKHPSFEIPAYGAWLPFDMEKCQWLPPYGDGVYADVLLRSTYIENTPLDIESTLELCFTNNPSAGFYVCSKEMFSEMKTVYNANAEAIYSTDAMYSSKWTNGLPTHHLLDENSYMVFRTRTKVDEHGNLISAHYGKILGEMKICRALMPESIFFNSSPNDMNLEDMATFKKSERDAKQRRGLK